MAEGELIGAACDQFVKLVGPTIKRQFNYLCCFTSNINNLEKEAKELDVAEEGIRMQVDTAVNGGRVIHPRVVKWFADSKEIKDEKTAVLDQVPHVGSVCLNLGARFSLSKRATKTAESMKSLRDGGKFDDISLPGPPSASKPVQLGNTCEFESRKKLEEEIMAVFKSGDVSMVGISGMGGLGKTTMAKRIKNRVLEERVFEEAVFVVVSQPIDKPKILLDIGGQLDLKLQDEHSETVRIQKLHQRLSSTKRILIVLDDVWQDIKLEEFGIPCDSKGCTILITSRNTDALRAMNVQKEYGMKILSEVEARFLFREKVGKCMDDPELKSIAEGIVKECEGLPIALAALGATLKGENDPSVWRDALRQLSQCVPEDADYIARVYAPLILSYDFLRSERAKFMFLLCSLYPEDKNIDVEELTYFGMGLGIFKGLKKLEEVRDNVSKLIKMLKSRSLLLDSEEGVGYYRILRGWPLRRNHVRMHDVVRDVCIFIAKREGLVGRNNCPWVSSFKMLEERFKLPTGLGSQNLHLLYLSPDCKYESSEGNAFRSDSAFFEENVDLYVLCIQSQRLLTSLPHSLKNLKSLVLNQCFGLETLFGIGELVNLEILICTNCDSIRELPLELKSLKGLKWLELTKCRDLQRIRQGIISSLVGLEELKMMSTFNKWESTDREERENAGLRELESLTNLRCLEIEIEDPTVAAEQIQFSSKIKSFHIIVSTRWDVKSKFIDDPYTKKMVLESKIEEPCLGNSIPMQLLRETEYLNLKGSGANSVDLVKCQNIRWLKLKECEDVKNVVTTSMVDDATALPASIEHLKLSKLPKLEGICDGPISSNSFSNLKELKLNDLEALEQLWKSSSPNISVLQVFANLTSIQINFCRRLSNLGPLSIAGKDCLPQLQELVIINCHMMEQVFLWKTEDESRNDSESRNDHCITKVFPKLKNVELSCLSNLTTFYHGIDGFEFPVLTKLSISYCQKLTSMGSNHHSRGSSADIDDNSLQHLLCQSKKVSFGNLKALTLVDQRNPFCGHEISVSLLNGLEELEFSEPYGSESLFSSLVARNLVNLRILEIRYCDEMLKVIEDDKEMIEEDKVVSDSAQMPLILFPKLEELNLRWLAKLVTFCEWKCTVKLPLLRKVTIEGCPNFEAFTTGLKNNLGTEASLGNLEKLAIYWTKGPLYGHKFFISIFKGLKELEVSWCHHNMNCVFTSSMVRCLDRLQVLIIRYCDEIVKVIEDEEDEEKVANGGGERTILFPKLWKLELINLAKLESFCEWTCDIELPSLRHEDIRRCPVFRNFTMGSIAAAPNLGNGNEDMNSVVQRNLQQCMGEKERREAWEKMERGEDEEKDYNEEEEEDDDEEQDEEEEDDDKDEEEMKGEIEECQN